MHDHGSRGDASGELQVVVVGRQSRWCGRRESTEREKKCMMQGEREREDAGGERKRERM